MHQRTPKLAIFSIQYCQIKNFQTHIYFLSGQNHLQRSRQIRNINKSPEFNYKQMKFSVLVANLTLSYTYHSMVLCTAFGPSFAFLYTLNPLGSQVSAEFTVDRNYLSDLSLKKNTLKDYLDIIMHNLIHLQVYRYFSEISENKHF